MMFNKIDVIQIITDHLETLTNNDTGNVRPIDLVLFFGIPVVVAVSLLAGLGSLEDQVLTIGATVFSILGGLLLNLLILVYESLQHWSERKEPDAEVGKLLHHTFRNISFGVLTAVVALLFILATAVSHGFVAKILSSFVYYLTCNFALTLLMVLKRVQSIANIAGDSKSGKDV